jgi:hypothetical protein
MKAMSLLQYAATKKLGNFELLVRLMVFTGEVAKQLLRQDSGTGVVILRPKTEDEKRQFKFLIIN